ncbi:MAG: hypothetical protein J6A29_01250 [Clostridia bacterium]|nr:hypothetical protein [Clostridia bacterium]
MKKISHNELSARCNATTAKASTAGITLVALVVTIIVLIILAGVSINMILGENGIITKAQEASALTEKTEIITEMQLEALTRRMDNARNLTNQDVVDIFSKYGEIQYEEDNQTVKSVTTDKGYVILASEVLGNEQISEAPVANGTYSYEKKVNTPQLLTGMTPLKYEYPTDEAMGVEVETTVKDKTWYEYGTTYETKRWANVVTKDSNGEISAYWVWIPRFAYKINSSEQTTDIVFLIGKTDKYYDEDGKIQTAKRCTSEDEVVLTTEGYTVHPAFTDESSINFRNGGWDSELSGIWVAKFEAGYASGNNDVEVVASQVNYSQTTGWAPNVEAGTSNSNGGATVTARNWLDGIYGSTQTSIKYPVFIGTSYSMNYINHNDSYNIAKALTGSSNIYGLNSTNADSHLMKNSEWGAVAYLSRSKYGLYNTDITINNATLNSGSTSTTKADGNEVASVYAVTGCTSNSTTTGEIVTTTSAINGVTGNTANTNGIYVWSQKTGQNASSTGTIYGIYDLSGATWERNASFVSNGNGNLLTYGKSLLDEAKVQYSTTVTANTGASTKYVTIYPNNDSGVTDTDIASKQNYIENTLIYGDSVRETSTAGIGSTSWYKDYSYFPGYIHPFFFRGGSWDHKSSTGLSYFNRVNGPGSYNGGFRAVLVGV